MMTGSAGIKLIRDLDGQKSASRPRTRLEPVAQAKSSSYSALDSRKRLLQLASKNYREAKLPAKPYIPELPTLIFAEKHSDAATRIAVSHLMHFFKRLGYGVFYDEVPQGLSADDIIEWVDAEQ